MPNLTRKFNKNDWVKLKRDPNRFGVIWEVISSASGWNYRIFFSATDRPIIAEDDLLASDEAESPTRLGSLTELLIKLFLLKRHTPLADNLYALHASRTEFQVYQFRPLVKFLANPESEHRLLIADEVGLGKTIEAGIILQELRARQDISKILIVCPSGLRSKWRDEMRTRFDETFDVLNAEQLRQACQERIRYGDNATIHWIVSLETIRRNEIFSLLTDANLAFDLVIIDEAHHCRNRGTLSYQIAHFLSETAAAMLLLTATPLQIGKEDLFNLLGLLAPADFENFSAFEEMLEPNRYLNEAAKLLGTQKIREAYLSLRRIPTTQFGTNDPNYQECLRLLEKETLSREELVRAQKYLLELNTLARILTRTRKREVYEKPAVREARTLTFRFTPSERKFYDAIVEAARADAQWQHGWVSAFTVIMRERQTASCISAAREHFEKLIASQAIEDLEENPVTAQGFSDALEDEKENAGPSLASLKRALAATQIPGEIDTKFEKFLEGIREVLTDDPSSKIIVFSFFRGTLNYLEKKLRRLGYPIEIIHGGVEILERERRINEFKTNPAIHLLLASEVGSEGLDFQFCNTLFNYDLPWNPMKIEQRIGRLDRFGQRYAKIRIYNLMIEDSIEDRIFTRLFVRIKIFQESIGDMEAILGEQIREISKRVFESRLTPAQEAELANRAIDNILRQKMDLEEFEEQRLQFMGQEAIFANDIEMARRTGRFISETEVKAVVSIYLSKKFPHTSLKENGDGTYALLPDIEFIQAVRGFVHGDRSKENFLLHLEDGKILPLTFSSSLAYDRKLVEFISLNHPLARMASNFWREEVHELPSLFKFTVAAGEKRPSGHYYFFVLRYTINGLQKRTTLKSLVVSAASITLHHELSESFLHLIQEINLASGASDIDFKRDEFEKAKYIAEEKAITERNSLAEENRRLNQSITAARLAGLERDFRVRQRRLEPLIREATHERIKRMYTAQLSNVKNRHLLKLEELNKQPEPTVEFTIELEGVMQIV